MIIAFMGNDGSGKTTIAKEVCKIFRDLGFEVIYKHEYQYTILRLLFEIIGMKKIESGRREMLVERKKSWKYYLWPLLVWLDGYFSYLYFKFFKKDAIVVLDRCLFDHYMSFKYLGYLTKFSEWLFLHSPRPDVCIVLWVESEIAYERKKSSHSYSLEFYEIQTRRYLTLSKNLELPRVNTNRSISWTIRDIFEILLDTQLAEKIVRRGLQNRIIFKVIKDHDLNLSALDSLTKSWNRKIKLFKNSVFILKKLMEKVGIKKYIVIKTVDDYRFVGNDIDVLISPVDFQAIVDFLRMKNQKQNYEIEKMDFHGRFDAGKIDIFLKNGLKLDIHSYVGWRNVEFFSFNELKNFSEDCKIFDENLVSVPPEINSVIIIITHIFEKGFVTLDEYLFFKKYLNEIIFRTNFPEQWKLLEEYVKWLKKILRNTPGEFPVFIPLKIIVKSYVRLLNSKFGSRYWKIKALMRDVSLMVFWRIRCVTKNKLPFEVDLNGF